ncbi:MAG: DUF4337 domain-containing protein, partial [Hyphomicrobium sp.]
MVWDELGRDAKKANAHERDKYIGVYIGILAVVLAICSVGGGNASSTAMFKNIEASNLWGFFQAKNIRRQELRLQADELEVMLGADPAMPEAARTQISTRVTDYRAQAQKLTTDAERKEGLDELFVKGKALEAERDQALQRGPYFDYGQALLQIAIVLASIAILAGGNVLLVMSAVLGTLGAIATTGGFTLAF